MFIIDKVGKIVYFYIRNTLYKSKLEFDETLECINSLNDGKLLVYGQEV